MGAPNFKPMLWKFPMFVIRDEDFEYTVCPHCNEEFWIGDTSGECPWCLQKYNKEDVETTFDEFDRDNKYEDVADWFEKKNYKYFCVVVESGYYADGQMVVNLTDDMKSCGFCDSEINGTKYVDDDSAEYYFEMKRDELMSDVDKEVQMVVADMREAAGEFGFVEVRTVGVFGNGEAVYEEVKR